MPWPCFAVVLPFFISNALRERFKKNPIESVIMIIADGGGGRGVYAGGDHTLLGFFQRFKPSCLARLSPKTNFVLI